MGEIVVKLTKKEAERLLEYIEFMENFDDDPAFRQEAISARDKLKNSL